MSLIKSGGGAKGALLLFSVALCATFSMGMAHAQQTAPVARQFFFQ